MTPEELAEKDFVDDRPERTVHIGVFDFNFENPADECCIAPDDIPDGCIGVDFWCEEMPWLLSEKCRFEKMDPPRFWEIKRKIKYLIKEKISQYENARELVKETSDSLLEAGILFEFMTKKELSEYRKEWVARFAPKNAKLKELNEICIKGGFLWHIFSYKRLETPPCERADALFEETPKDSAVLVLNIDDLGLRIYNPEKISADFLKTSFMDVTVTASDFSWTYSATHEEYLGPYYYKKSEDL